MTRTQIAPRERRRSFREDHDAVRKPASAAPATVELAGDHRRERLEHGPGCDRDSGGNDDV